MKHDLDLRQTIDQFLPNGGQITKCPTKQAIGYEPQKTHVRSRSKKYYRSY